MSGPTVFWAHINELGKPVAWGRSIGTDVFLQPLTFGLTAVARPEHVTGFGKWHYVNDQWVELDLLE